MRGVSAAHAERTGGGGGCPAGEEACPGVCRLQSGELPCIRTSVVRIVTDCNQ